MLEAIKRALKEPVLENVKVTATQMKLEQAEGSVLGTEGSGEPVWKLKLWAAKNGDVGETDIGEMWVSATDGKIVKADLHTDKLG
jgi:hypothetical protein